MSKKILVVEDEAISREMLESLLDEAGFSVYTAENGQIGLEQSLQIMPDLIITDAMMPEMDGFELCRQLRQHPQTKSTPIILLTAMGSKESVVNGFSAGADDYITKPFNTEELLARLRRILRWSSQQEEQSLILLRGDLVEKPLVEVLRFCEEQRVNGTIHLTLGEEQGQINLASGEIISVKMEDKADEIALDALLEWEEGTFTVEQQKVQIETDLSETSDESSETEQKMGGRILIVDGDPNILNQLENDLKQHYEILTTQTGEKALELLANEIFGEDNDLLITNMNLSPMSGFDLVMMAKEAYPRLRVVVILESLTSPPQEALLNREGTIFYVETSKIIDNTLSVVNNILGKTTEEGDLLTLVDLIQLYGLNSCEVAITVEQNGEKGYIYLEKGQITSARYNKTVGKTALDELLSWNEGKYTIRYGVVAKNKNIQQSFANILYPDQDTSDQTDDTSLVHDQVNETIQNILFKLKEQSDAIEDAIAMRLDGAILGSTSPTTAVSLAKLVMNVFQKYDKLNQQFDLGMMAEIVIHGENGLLAIDNMKDSFLLAVTVSESLKLGMIRWDCLEAMEDIEKII